MDIKKARRRSLRIQLYPVSSVTANSEGLKSDSGLYGSVWLPEQDKCHLSDQHSAADISELMAVTDSQPSESYHVDRCTLSANNISRHISPTSELICFNQLHESLTAAPHVSFETSTNKLATDTLVNKGFCFEQSPATLHICKSREPEQDFEIPPLADFNIVRVMLGHSPPCNKMKCSGVHPDCVHTESAQATCNVKTLNESDTISNKFKASISTPLNSDVNFPSSMICSSDVLNVSRCISAADQRVHSPAVDTVNSHVDVCSFSCVDVKENTGNKENQYSYVPNLGGNVIRNDMLTYEQIENQTVEGLIQNLSTVQHTIAPEFLQRLSLHNPDDNLTKSVHVSSVLYPPMLAEFCCTHVASDQSYLNNCPEQSNDCQLPFNVEINTDATNQFQNFCSESGEKLKVIHSVDKTLVTVISANNKQAAKTRKERRRSAFGAELKLDAFIPQKSPCHDGQQSHCSPEIEVESKPCAFVRSDDIKLLESMPDYRVDLTENAYCGNSETDMKQKDGEHGGMCCQTSGQQLQHSGPKRKKKLSADFSNFSQEYQGLDQFDVPLLDISDSSALKRRRSSLRLYCRQSQKLSVPSTVSDENDDGAQNEHSKLTQVSKNMEMELPVLSPNASSISCLDQEKTENLMISSELKSLYFNKNYTKPTSKTWETIFESPSKGKMTSKQKLRRYLQFEDVPMAKFKKRLKRAIQNGWSIDKKGQGISDLEVKKKLQQLDDEIFYISKS